MKTQVGIVGCGPAGLLLSQLLHINGIETVILERQTQDYVQTRVRAGILEQGSVDVLLSAGVGERLLREGMVHEGIELAFHGRRQRVNLRELTGGTVTVYGQTEVTKDLIRARQAAGGSIFFEAQEVVPEKFATDTPRLRFHYQGGVRQIECDFIVGCDGFYSVCRASVPESRLCLYERDYPFAWLGVLAKAPPVSSELIYSRHPRGFSLCSMRSPTLSRHYLQCAPDESLNAWSADRFWEELQRRLGAETEVVAGPVLEMNVLPTRSFVAEPLRFERLFLAGDAAHIVPPTGAKGLNLAVSDVCYLSRAITTFYRKGCEDELNAYSARALARVWKAQRFSWWMTALMHNFPNNASFENRLRSAELEYVLSSQAALASLSENYVGLPL